jgi:hypothetical protein
MTDNMTTTQIYERLHPDDPIVRAVLAERQRCAAIVRSHLVEYQGAVVGVHAEKILGEIENP